LQGRRLRFSPDGRYLAEVWAGVATVLDARTGDKLAHLSEPGSVYDVAFSAASDRLTLVDQSGTVRIKDVPTGQVVRTIPLPVADDPTLGRVVLGRNGTLVARVGRSPAPRSPIPTIQVHDLEGGAPAEIKGIATSMLADADFSPTGRYLAVAVAGSEQTWIYAYDRPGRRLELAATLATPGVRQVAFDPTGVHLATLSAPNHVRIWLSQVGREQFDLRFRSPATVYGQGILHVAFSPDGRRLAVAAGSDAVRIAPADAAPEARNLVVVNRSRSSALSLDGHTLVQANPDTTVSIRDVAAKREVRRLPAHPDQVRALRISPDGLTLACRCADHSVHVWPLDGGPQLAAYQWRPTSGPAPAAPRLGSWPISFSPDSQSLAAYFPDNAIHVWEARSGRQLRLIPGPADGGPLSDLAFSLDGGRLLATTRNAFRVWAVETGQELVTRAAPAESIYRWLVCRPQTDQVALGYSDGTIRFLNAATGDVVTALTGHTTMAGLAISPDGRRLVSAGDDRVMKLWDLTTGRELLSFPEYTAGAHFSSDGTRLYTVSAESTLAHLKLWDGRPLDAPSEAGTVGGGDSR
jgi:WD40 repeat protein